MKLKAMFKAAKKIWQAFKSFWKELKEAIQAGKDLVDEVVDATDGDGEKKDDGDPPLDLEHIRDPAYPGRSDDLKF